MFNNILSIKNNNIFAGLGYEKEQYYKQLVYSMILYTDMTFHNQLVKDFSEIEFNETERSRDTEGTTKKLDQGSLKVKYLKTYEIIDFDKIRY